MINDLILKDTTRDEWPAIRERLKSRILKNIGKFPVSLEPSAARYEELEKYDEHGFTHIKIKYHVFADEWNYAVIVLPKDLCARGRAKAVIATHGTNGLAGKYGMMDPVERPNRNYALELAERGYVVIAADQFGFGEVMSTEEGRRKFDDFYSNYPDWSLTGRRVLDHVRALDVLDSLDYVIKDSGYGVIGNSLGGQAALYIAGLDERIGAAVVSTGLSPHASNAYRLVRKEPRLHPIETDALEKNGKSPWELNEMLGLCAPRAVLCIEPFNDPYNPFTAVSFECVKSAQKVYSLLGADQKLSMYIHGDGHDTVDEVRNLAYDWLDRFLK